MKKRRFLLPSALLGALLFVGAPAMAQSHTVLPSGTPVGFGGIGGNDFAAVYIDGDGGTAGYHETDGTLEETVSTIIHSNFLINSFSVDAGTQADASRRYFGISIDAANLLDNTFTTRDSTVAGNVSGLLFGLGLRAEDDFDGIINADTITVFNRGAGGTVGITLGLFDDSAGIDWKDFGGVLNVGAVNVRGGVRNVNGQLVAATNLAGDNVTGIQLWGRLDGSAVFDVGQIDVIGATTSDNHVQGISILGDDQAGSVLTFGGNISVENLSNQNRANAYGINMDTASGTDSAEAVVNLLNTASIRTIANNSSQALAVRFTGSANELNIIAAPENGNGWFTNNGNVFNVQAGNTHGNANTYKANNVDVYFDSNAQLVGRLINVRDIEIEDGRDVRFFGNIHLVGDSGGTSAGTSTIEIGDGATFAFAIGNNSLSGRPFVNAADGVSLDLVMGANSTAVLYGEALDTRIRDAFGGFGAGAGATVISRSIFGEYGWWVSAAGDNLEKAEQGTGYFRWKRTPTANNMNDAFLVAALMHQRYTGLTMVNPHFISAQSHRNGFRGQAWNCDPCAPVACDPCAPVGFGRGGRNASAGRAAWVNYVGRSNTFADWKMGTDGVQVGTDLFRTNRAQLGVIFGYEGGWATSDGDAILPGQDRLNSDNIYLGFYGARVLRNGVDVRFVYNHGRQKFNMSRLDYEDARVYESSFRGRTNEYNFELGRRIHSGAWSLRPFGAVDVFTTQLRGAQESAGIESVGYAKMRMNQTFLRSGFELNFQRNRFGFDTGLSYAYCVNSPKFHADATARMRMPNLSTPVDRPETLTLQGAKLGRELLMVNVGGSYLIGRNFTVFGGYDLQAVVDRSGGVQHIGHVGGKVNW